MASIDVVDTTPDHIAELARTMSKDDRIECIDFGVKPRIALAQSFERSFWSRTLLIDGDVAAIWGVGGTHLLADVGNPWLLTSDAVAKAPLACIRIARAEMLKELELRSVLTQLVSARHHKAIRTMQAIGFSVGPATPAGKFGKPFCTIEMRA